MKNENAPLRIGITGCVASIWFLSEAPHIESLHFPFSCPDVAGKAMSYLSEHGVLTYETARFQTISVIGRIGRKDKPWTDAQGKEITDFKVYWTYADRSTGDKEIFGIWRVRMAHYQPKGEIKLTPGDQGCNADFRLAFEAWGAMVIGILPADSQWEYSSTGRLEREYLEGISAALAQRKPNQ